MEIIKGSKYLRTRNLYWNAFVSDLDEFFLVIWKLHLSKKKITYLEDKKKLDSESLNAEFLVQSGIQWGNNSL